ncbi:MAG: 2-C-methyl-D-erythritol 4-phosphate cytidylyltransferase [Firmicutes bacterium]|nr:2-C-methyl-D-erythritol 4-phosphate cytidylyltransferase [Bacillota bacterium]
MITALIFAGGTGMRMNSKSRPKQFLELHGKAIIIHTLEFFEEHDEIDNIAVVCLESWMEHLKHIIKRNGFEKIKWYINGSKTGQGSIYNGLKTIYQYSENPSEDIVLIHDGVRPLITSELISTCINSVKKNGNAITVTPVKETIVTVEENTVISTTPREITKIAKAPQCFYLEDIMKIHNKALSDGIISSTDSASLMLKYNKTLYTVDGPAENIKITTPLDYYIFRAIYEARENSQILGY